MGRGQDAQFRAKLLLLTQGAQLQKTHIACKTSIRHLLPLGLCSKCRTHERKMKADKRQKLRMRFELKDKPDARVHLGW